MRIRLHGTPAELAAMLDVLTETLDVQQVSRTYTDRPPSQLGRVYLDATPRTATDCNERR